MASEFQVELNPSEKLCREVAALAPRNPFYAFEYVGCKRAAGFEPWMLLLYTDGQLVSGCPAFVRRGFLTRRLEVESSPVIPEPGVFWQGLLELCRSSHISDFGIYNFASQTAEIPRLAGETWRAPRLEFVMELQGRDLWEQLDRGHRRRVNQARKAGITVIRTTNSHAWKEHISAVEASKHRREARGERLSEIRELGFLESLLHNGPGELFQAVLDGKVVSSDLVIKACRGVYALMGGTQPEGMALGAAHFLEFETMRQLQEEGFEVFNQGGARLDTKGLIEWKRGFRTTEIKLEAAEFCLGSRLKTRIGRAVDLARNDPGLFWKRSAARLASLFHAKSPEQ